jgi:hypothetical protein
VPKVVPMASRKVVHLDEPMVQDWVEHSVRGLGRQTVPGKGVHLVQMMGGPTELWLDFRMGRMKECRWGWH